MFMIQENFAWKRPEILSYFYLIKKKIEDDLFISALIYLKIKHFEKYFVQK